MTSQLPDDMTVWLKKLDHGDSESLDHVMGLVYQEMRLLARKQMRSERVDHTLCTTGLVNEAYLKLRKQSAMQFASRQEFFTFASQCMRHILVDYARGHTAEKRGSGEKPASLSTSIESINGLNAQEICEIDSAMNRLEQLFPRGAEVIQLRLFGGLNLNEIAEINEVSSKTVQRDWTSAIAWLRKEVSKPLPPIVN